jgi:Rhodopirellula transposase.
MTNENAIAQRFELINPYLNERTRRIFLAAEAMSIGWGGVTKVSLATGVSRDAITDGVRELKALERLDVKRIRKKGGGRKKIVDIDSTLISDLENLIEPVTRGDPESPLRWTCKSLRRLAEELNREGHNVSHTRVAEILHLMGYSLQANKKLLKAQVTRIVIPSLNTYIQKLKNFNREDNL